MPAFENFLGALNESLGQYFLAGHEGESDRYAEINEFQHRPYSPPDYLDPSDEVPSALYGEELVESDAPFAIFVSDFHASDFGPGDDFRFGHEKVWIDGSGAMRASRATLLFEVLSHAIQYARNTVGGPIDLVLNGDVFDLLEVLGRSTKLQHHPLLSVFRWFRDEDSSNRIIYVLGNHDYHCPQTYEPVINDIARSYYNRTLRTFAIHGHQWDASNANPTDPESFGSNLARTVAEMEVRQRGQWASIGFPTLLDSPYFYPGLLVDNLRPISRAAKYLEDTFPNVRRLFGNDRLLDLILSAQDLDSDNSLVEAASQLLNGSARDFNENTINAQGAEYVIMGHSHLPVVSDHYFNLGCWLPLYYQHREGPGEWSAQHPVLLIHGDRAAHGAVHTHYLMNDFSSNLQYREATPGDTNALREAIVLNPMTLDANNRVIPTR